jgi:hypothetical protein
MASVEYNWTAFLLVTSLSAFLLGWFLVGFHAFDRLAAENQGRMLGFFLLLVVALIFSWLAFIYTLKNFRFYDDKRWAWFYAIASDMVATLITVAGLYSAFSMIYSIGSL